jgi:uncharacterized repeat protein (TIGR03803 family)
VIGLGCRRIRHAFRPACGVIQGTDGNFYGTTGEGGSRNAGTVYKLTPLGIETVLYSFTGGISDGLGPGGLVQGNDGNFYGTAQGDGASGYGIIFMVTPTGVERVLYSFTGGSDEGSPSGALIQGNDGSFYGTTQFSPAAGTVFSF